MKTFKYILILLFLLLIAGFITLSLHGGQPENQEEQSETIIYQDSSFQVDEEVLLSNLNLEAESALLINADNQQLLYEKNINRSLPVASMSKMMTEYLVLEAINNGNLTWEQQIPISDYASAISNTPGFSSILLKKELTYTVEELFHATAIHSANGAAIALAEAVAGSEKEFVQLMNQTAERIGLEKSTFVNSTGLSNSDLGSYSYANLPSPDNMMSVKDVASLALELLNTYPEILHISSMPSQTVTHGSQDAITYYNTNSMLPEMNEENISYSGVDGLKTGYTDVAGYCFTGTVQQGGTRYVSVIMGAGTENARFSDTKKLYDAAFNSVD
ncbi:D-alanyl-D-alanine carboxypeptidase family protein [Sediminibacillus albus]|uniref:D-alanyl-D-alanine carboxypeptidase (Penicillin-binding protein 5/6) n=1 Tax=Sediminibacillus albus TaxID=407036 RepID=A0A1G9APD5_9BACI|nr:D-alanyl-D-alanine carboxypeptidase family protein [Sediminibacillus albus]SDK29137.1 D-alanyl-D-alanine carboxypeptidase (penicillin-binding protein 5/6) [Sediminibacillus albus]